MLQDIVHLQIIAATSHLITQVARERPTNMTAFEDSRYKRLPNHRQYLSYCKIMSAKTN